MRVFQNRIFLGSMCILLAAVVAFFVIPGINKSKNNTEKIIKFSSDVYAGTQIKEDMVTETEVGSFGLPKSVIKNKDDIVGKYAICDIKADDLILSDKISDYAANEKLDRIYENGQKLITVSIESIAAGVGNHIKAGDIISVIYYKDNTAIRKPELNNIEVYSVRNSEAVDIDDSSIDNEAKDKIASTITLIVNNTQAEALVVAEYSGKLHLVFEKRGV
ncbi:MAG: Flp pilus assembly protein CpaB [Firmicutes bacterium]|nr:Flp pilus assembly protein CpaB [Bacillota bacterium]